ncbi:putative ankyrin repeat-containing domain-containing protein [Lupinus albus]|uniref:Putative ankyrin repeat-containing domain-containing protein n=1 Tax=Lupinus albus TaxID=3870 RepID=A0A6A4NKD0_LUPAL|nr:putative ankyrin repeat-containing domain-containing protein [Lupinus albus]
MQSMAPSNFPLRWKSIGDQWWYASPIDWAAANGLYDLVVELLHLDTNLLIKLTSLRRIRRLETVWDDNDDDDDDVDDDDDDDSRTQFKDVAKCRSHVAKNLMFECENEGSGGDKNKNSLIRAGYGGWLLYTAASAGDVGFVQELLGRYPFLVFGEGEYGVTDILYAAARSKNFEVFKLLLDSALSQSIGADLENGDESEGIFKSDVMNRAIHAAARGGNWEILKQLFGSASDLLAYRDSLGCTVLHTAAGRGKVEVVRNLVASCDIINTTDSEGNTALHVASYKGYLPLIQILILESPSLPLLTNHHGDTFLHMAVAGFRSPGFRRLDKHTEFMKQLVSENIVKLHDIINIRNNDGKTALHVAVIDNNIQFELVELLISVPSIDLNIEDSNGMTPLDILKQRSSSASSEILIKKLVSNGGISNHKDCNARNNNTLFSIMKTHGIGVSPGTSFRIPDSEIFLYTSIENVAKDGNNYDQASVESNSSSGELSNASELADSRYNNNSKTSSINHAARRLKFLFGWPRRRGTKASTSELEDYGDSLDPYNSSRNMEEFPISLRQRYTQQCSLLNIKRTQSIRTCNNLPSPLSKVKFTTGLMQGVIQGVGWNSSLVSRLKLAWTRQWMYLKMCSDDQVSI